MKYLKYETCRGPFFTEGSYDNQGFSSLTDLFKTIGISKSTPQVILNDFEQKAIAYWKTPSRVLCGGDPLHYKVNGEIVHIRRCMYCRGKAVLYSSPWT